MNIKKAARCLRLISEQLEPPAEPAAQAPEPEADPVEVTAAEQAARIAAGKEAHLRANLAELPLGQLKKRARAEGLDEDAVDDVDDADDPKAAIIELLVAAAASAAQNQARWT